MQAYIVKRVLLFIPTAFLVATLVFVILRLVPGDPAINKLAGFGGLQAYTPEDLARVRASMGTDIPLISQYGKWLWGVVHLDFGDSFTFETPVWTDVKNKFPITIELTVVALLISGVVAVPLGVLSAVNQDTWPDYLGRMVTISGIALPNFWIGVLVVYFLSNQFNWLPPLGYADLWDDPLKNLQQIIFPAMVLALSNMAYMARITRSATLEVFREDYIRTARAKGLAEKVVIWRHTLKNALLPIITISGIQFGSLMGGTVIIETIFNIPGMGSLLIKAITTRDYPQVQAIVIIITVLVLALNLLVDVLYAWLNPRIRYA